MRIKQAGNLTLVLGKQGEDRAVQVRFPARPWRETYGEGLFRLIVRRSGEAEPYAAELTADGDDVCWTVSGTDTARAGLGACELQYFTGGALAKSRTWATRVTGSLSGAESGFDLPRPPDGTAYGGEYEVVPRAGAAVVLPTARKYLEKDVTVEKIPVWETSNASGGYTAVIGG